MKAIALRHRNCPVASHFPGTNHVPPNYHSLDPALFLSFYVLFRHLPVTINTAQTRGAQLKKDKPPQVTTIINKKHV